MILKSGSRLFSAVCTAEFMSIKVPKIVVELTIGGASPVSSAAERNGVRAPSPGHDGGSLMGKRYVDDADTIELLCTKPGAGTPAVDGNLLQLKQAKALPASD